MKKFLSNLLLITVFCASTSAQTFFDTKSQSRRTEYTREIKKEFSVSAGPNLYVVSKYSSITVVEGSSNRIAFEIEIIGRGDNIQLAKECAEKIDVTFSQSGNKISAVTKFAEVNNNGGNKCHFEIKTYKIYVPKNTKLEIENKYGNVYLGDCIKTLDAKLKYGNLSAKNIATVSVDLGYGNFQMDDGNNMKLTTKYSGVKIGKIGRLDMESKYDKISISEVSDLNLDTKYTNVSIKKLNNLFVANDFNYCDLNIKNISTDFSKIKIDAAYSKIRLGLNENHSFKANLSARYGEIYMGSITLNDSTVGGERFTKKISGTVGKNPKATVEISNAYDNIIFE